MKTDTKITIGGKKSSNHQKKEKRYLGIQSHILGFSRQLKGLVQRPIYIEAEPAKKVYSWIIKEPNKGVASLNKTFT